MPSETVCVAPYHGIEESPVWPKSNRPAPVLPYRLPVRRGEAVSFTSQQANIAGTLFLPEVPGRAPVVIVCHGAGDWKENYFELCHYLAEQGIGSLAIDLHGHGESGGDRFCVVMKEWEADVQAAVEFLSNHPRVDAERIAGFGLSSGGTAILEAALTQPKLKALIALDATVHDSLPRSESWFLKALLVLGRVKRALTGSALRLPLAKLSSPPKIASDPEVNQQIFDNPASMAAFLSFPLPGGEEAFFVDTIKRVSRIKAPTLVLWGEDDKVDPVSTAHLLFKTLTCPKDLQIVSGNGHVGHLDRNRSQVFELTAAWLREHLAPARQAQATGTAGK